MQKPRIFSQTHWISVLSIVLIVTGCSSADRKATVFGDDLPTINDIYQQQMSRSDKRPHELSRVIHADSDDLHAGLRHTYRQLQQQFPLLPNPVLLVYVYPHLTDAGVPVPGYYTVFSFYRENQYAAPSDGVIVPSPVNE